MSAETDPFGLVGTTIAEKYRVDRLLGEGGFGVVYAGFHLVLGQPVAIKCMKPSSGDAAAQQKVTELFLREARVLFGLTHPSIVRMYDVGTLPLRSATGGWAPTVPYVVLEFLEGRSLEEEITHRKANQAPGFSTEELISLFEQVLEAVAFAHEKGIIHRDIKPSNVMLAFAPSGLVAKVVDFGIARIESTQQTTGGMPFTPRYAAPEQWDRALGNVGPGTDIFALGLLVVEAITGNHALPGDSFAQLFGSAMNAANRPRITSSRPDLPPQLDQVVAGATHVHPEQRYQSVRDFKRALLGVLHAPTPGTVAVPAPSPGLAPTMLTSGTGGPYTTSAQFGAGAQTAQPTGGFRGAHIMVIAIVAILALAAVAGVGVLGFFGWKAVEEIAFWEPGFSQPAIPETPMPQPTAPLPTAAPTAAPPAKGLLVVHSVVSSNYGGQAIRNVVEPDLGALEACYEKAFAPTGRAEMDVHLTITTHKTGRPKYVMCSTQPPVTTAKNQMCDCIQDRASRWMFPKPVAVIPTIQIGSAIIQLKTRVNPAPK